MTARLLRYQQVLSCRLGKRYLKCRWMSCLQHRFRHQFKARRIRQKLPHCRPQVRASVPLAVVVQLQLESYVSSPRIRLRWLRTTHHLHPHPCPQWKIWNYIEDGRMTCCRHRVSMDLCISCLDDWSRRPAVVTALVFRLAVLSTRAPHAT